MVGRSNVGNSIGQTVARPAVRGRRRIVRLLRLLVFTLVAIPLMIWLVTPVALVYRFLHPARMAVTTQLRDLPFPAENVAITAPDGAVLYGWFARRSATAPVILVGHGFEHTR